MLQWEHRTDSGIHSHKFYRQNQDTFNEFNDQASWGNWYWSTREQDGLTYQIGQDTKVRSQFVDNGRLDNSVDTEFREIRDRW